MLSLTHDDYKNIKMLYTTTTQIFIYYCQLIKLEKNNKINTKAFDNTLNKIIEQENTENQLIIKLCEDIDKTEFIMNIIEENQPSINPSITKRLLIKLNKRLIKLMYIDINKNLKESKNDFSDKKYNFYQYQKNNLITKEYKLAIIKDIFEISRYYLNQEINNSTNKTITSQLISRKYKDLFLLLDNSINLLNYINANNLTLNFDFIYEFLEQEKNQKYNEEEKNITKNLLIIEQLFYYAEIMLKNNNKITTDSEINILKSYISGCLYLLNDETKNNILHFLRQQNNNTEGARILFSLFEEKNIPKVKSVHLKIK